MDETGVLLRDGEDIVLRRDEGGRWALDMNWLKDAPVNERVRVIGIMIAAERVYIHSIAPAP